MTHSFLQVSSTRWLRSLLIVLLFLCAAGQTGIGKAKTPPQPPGLELTFDDGLISAELVDAPLVDVLERIKQEFGFTTHYHGDLTELVTLSFTDMPLSKTLRLLTANQSLSVATRPVADASEQNDTKQITEIWVLSRSPVSKGDNLAPGASQAPAPNEPDSTVNIGENSLEMMENQQQEGFLTDQASNDQKAEMSSRRQTIKNLITIGDSASVMAMAEYTRDADREMRKLAVTGISLVQNEESTQILGQVLQDESDPEIRKIALRALRQRQNDMAAQALLEGALNDADPETTSPSGQMLTE
jgi:hypothetical protein